MNTVLDENKKLCLVCSTLLHTDTYCRTLPLQHAAIHCNTLKHTVLDENKTLCLVCIDALLSRHWFDNTITMTTMIKIIMTTKAFVTILSYTRRFQAKSLP